mmetsp:Transcript_64393/g.74866  ORF Transcript_64393/g.74866 Transcript_64393/m.74866 type:complete len:293 (-) Transcript_64393:174-1052(-)
MADTENTHHGGQEGHSHANAKQVAETGLLVLKHASEKAQKIVEEQEQTKKKLQERVSQLKTEVVATEEVARDSKNKLKQAQEAIVSIKDQLLTLNQNKIKAASAIASQFNSIKRIYIEEPTDVSNQLFKWYLAVVYNESPSKYDFANFINETIVKDKGVDFENRLKGLRAFELGKDEAAVTTATLAQEDAIRKEMEEFNPSYLAAVTDLFNYIHIIEEIIKVREELKKLDWNYAKVYKKSDIDSALYLKAFTRYECAKNDLALSEKAIKTFSKVLELSQSTQHLCKEQLGHH